MRYLPMPAVLILMLLSGPGLLKAAEPEAFTEPEAIRAVAAAAVGDGNGSVEATVDSALRMATCSQQLEAVPTSARIVQVRCPDQPGWRLYVPVKIRRVADVVVLTEPVKAGETITADMLAVRKRDMAGQGTGFADPAEVIGMTPERGMAMGAPLTNSDVFEGSALKRGDPVVVVSRFGGIEVRMTGKALGKASPGGAVSVENSQSRRIIRGRLIGDGLVEVLR